MLQLRINSLIPRSNTNKFEVKCIIRNEIMKVNIMYKIIISKINHQKIILKLKSISGVASFLG